MCQNLISLAMSAQCSITALLMRRKHPNSRPVKLFKKTERQPFHQKLFFNCVVTSADSDDDNNNVDNDDDDNNNVDDGDDDSNNVDDVDSDEQFF